MNDRDRPPAITRQCGVCGFVFSFDGGFYRARGLRDPRRCPWCRAARRRGASAPLRLTGHVEQACEKYAFVRSEAGALYFAHVSNIAPGDWPLAPGARVSFEPAADPRSYHQPGRRPRAYVVRVVDVEAHLA